MRIIGNKTIVSILMTFAILICVFSLSGQKSYAIEEKQLEAPTINSFNISDLEDNALKVTFTSNNQNSNYSYELVNITTKIQNNFSGSYNSFVLQNLEENTTYSILLRVCTNSEDTYSCSNYTSSSATTKKASSETPQETTPTTPSTPSTPKPLSTPVLKGAAKYNNYVTLSWNKISNAKGYEIYRGSSLLKTVTSTSYKNTGLKAKTSYKYKVRAYYVSGGKKVYSNFSKVITVTAKSKTIKLILVSNNRKDLSRYVTRFKDYSNAKVERVNTLSYSSDKKFQKYLNKAVKKYDGLIIPGGGNINPKYYGAKKHSSTKIESSANDRRQIAAVKTFAKEKKPVLGICRGNQIINVAFGGTLKQDFNLKTKERVYHNKYHNIKNIKGSWMYQLFGETKYTYQHHHQFIKKLGKNLKATAWSVPTKKYEKHIEAIEHTSLPIYGVQWHPDRETKKTKSGSLFKSFENICIDALNK